MPFLFAFFTCEFCKDKGMKMQWKKFIICPKCGCIWNGEIQQWEKADFPILRQVLKECNEEFESSIKWLREKIDNFGELPYRTVK